MNPYNRQIIEFTGCTEDDAGMIQDIMRNFIFHSTLDWQSAAQLRRAALEARQILEADRSPWEEYRASCRQMFEEGKRAERETAARVEATRLEPSHEG